MSLPILFGIMLDKPPLVNRIPRELKDMTIFANFDIISFVFSFGTGLKLNLLSFCNKLKDRIELFEKKIRRVKKQKFKQPYKK